MIADGGAAGRALTIGRGITDFVAGVDGAIDGEALYQGK